MRSLPRPIASLFCACCAAVASLCAQAADLPAAANAAPTAAPSAAATEALTTAPPEADAFPEPEVEVVEEDEGESPSDEPPCCAVRMNLVDLAFGILNAGYDRSFTPRLSAGVEGGFRNFRFADSALLAWSIGLRGDWIALGSSEEGALSLGVAWRYALTEEEPSAVAIVKRGAGHHLGVAFSAHKHWAGGFTLRAGLRLEREIAPARGRLRDRARVGFDAAGHLLPELSAGFAF